MLRLAQPAAVAVKAEDGGAEETAADGGDGDLPPPDALALAADVDDALGVVGDVDDDDVLGAVDLLDVPIDGPLLADGADGFEFAPPPFDGDGDGGGGDGGDASEDDVRCQACRGRHVRHTCGKGKHGRPKKGAAKAKGGAAAAHSTKKPRQGIPVSGEDAKTEPAAGCPPGMTDAHYSDLFNTTIKEGTHPHDPSKNTHAFPELLQGGSAERSPAPASAERGLAPVASESMETAEAQFVFGDRRAKTSRSRDEDGDDDPPPDGCDESGSGQIPK